MRTSELTISFKRIDHVGTVVTDLDASVEWDCEHFGLKKMTEYAFPGARVAFAGLGDLRLEFFQTKGAAAMTSEREERWTNLRIGGINHFAIGVDDLDAALAQLKEAGVEMESEPAEVGDGRGDRFAFVRDNERMLVELFQRGT